MLFMLIDIYFKVRCETKARQDVKIVGDIIQLGEWNPQQGLILNTNKDIYPIWQGVLQVQLKKNTLIQFKAVIQEENQYFWEQIDNRAIQIRFYSQSVIFAFNGQFTKMIKIKSFSESNSDSDSDSIEISQVHRIQYYNHQHSIDFEFISSDSGQDSNDFSEFLQENILSKAKSLDQSDNESLKALSCLQVQSFKL